MAICDITGKRFQAGNNVSHAVNKTRRRFEVNLQKKRLFSQLLGWCSLNVSVHGLKIVEIKGGLDSFLESSRKLYANGEKLRNQYLKAKSKKQKATNA